VAKVIAPFEHDVINEHEPFDQVNPTPCMVARYVFEGVQNNLKEGAPKGLAVKRVSVKAGGEEGMFFEKDKLIDNGDLSR